VKNAEECRLLAVSILYFRHRSSILYQKNYSLRFEVFRAVTMKNIVFWDVTPCGSCMNQCFWGTYRFHHQGDKKRRARDSVSSG
jgi:hypothetical protein